MYGSLEAQQNVKVVQLKHLALESEHRVDELSQKVFVEQPLIS